VSINGIPPSSQTPKIDEKGGNDHPTNANTNALDPTTPYTLLASQAFFGTYPSMNPFLEDEMIPILSSSSSSSSLDNNPLMCNTPSLLNNPLRDVILSKFIQTDKKSVLIVPRGKCSFEQKAYNAQLYGASALIIYGTLNSRYSFNETTQEVIYPRQFNDYDCNLWEAEIPLSNLNLKSGYDANKNDAVLSGDSTSANSCAQGNANFDSKCKSQSCLLTGNTTHSVLDGGMGTMKACCAWDLHIWLYADHSMLSNATDGGTDSDTDSGADTTPKDPITIPAFYISRSQSQALFTTMQYYSSSSSTTTNENPVLLTLYKRWYPQYNSSTILIWALGVFVAALAAYMSAADYREAAKGIIRFRNLHLEDTSTTSSTGGRSVRNPEYQRVPNGGNGSNSGNGGNGGGGASAMPEGETLELNAYHALGFILFSTAGLLTLFFFKIYNLVKIMYGIGCGSAMMQIIFLPLISRLANKIQYPNRVAFVTDVLELGTVTIFEVASAICAYGLSIVWLIIAFTQYHPDTIPFFWIMQDVMGACMCITFLATVKVNSIRIASILLICAFFYDIFFVFVTPYLTKGGKSIMVDVATSGGPPTADPLWCEKYPKDVNCQGGDPLPMLLTVPRVMDYSGGSSLLGLGDIVLPGLLLSFAARYDEAKRFFRTRQNGSNNTDNSSSHLDICSPSSSNSSHKRTYFTAVVISYAIGLMMANIAVYVMQMGQPALLYLVPCCLGTICVLGYKRGELVDLWNTPKVIVSCDEILYGGDVADGGGVSVSGAIGNGSVGIGEDGSIASSSQQEMTPTVASLEGSRQKDDGISSSNTIGTKGETSSLFLNEESTVGNNDDGKGGSGLLS